MKKTKIVIIALVLLLCLTSCESKPCICYYGYFSDTAFVLIYSNAKNTLYYVDLPLDVLFQWGTIHNMESVPDVMKDFTDLDGDGFMLGNRQNIDAVRDILDTMSSTGNGSVEDRLNTAVNRSRDFLNQSLLAKMSRLCSCDLGLLVKTLAQAHPKVKIMDASVVLDSQNIEFANDYLRIWIKQIIE